MKVRFFAKADGLVREAGHYPQIGQAPRYVGREYVPLEGGGASFPATKDGSQYDAESEEGQSAMRRCRKGELWPADPETAALCGVKFTAVSFASGVFVEKPTAAQKSSASGVKDD